MQKILISLVFTLTASLAVANPAAELATLLGGVQNLHADFQQTVADDEGEVLEESSGNMAFQRPDHLRWEVAEPYRYLILTDGETLWRYDPDFEQLSTEAFSSVSQTPLMILAASADDLENRYRIRVETVEGQQVFSLSPRDEEAEFSELTLSFAADKLVKMTLLDKLGQQTEIALSAVELNGEALPDSHFVFKQNGEGATP